MGETRIFHLIVHTVKHKHITLEIDMFEQLAILHLPFRMLFGKRGFKLKLDYAYRLVHLGYETLCLFHCG